MERRLVISLACETGLCQVVKCALLADRARACFLSSGHKQAMNRVFLIFEKSCVWIPRAFTLWIEPVRVSNPLRKCVAGFTEM